MIETALGKKNKLDNAASKLDNARQKLEKREE